MGKVMLKAYLYVVFFAAFFLINACVNAASFSVNRVQYRLINGFWRNGDQALCARTLRDKIAGIMEGNDAMVSEAPAVDPEDRKVAVMSTIGRLLLAQARREYNVPNNSNWSYGNGKSNELPAVLDSLLSHWLTHGHLGFFPMMSTPRHENGFANLQLSRGVFNIVSSVMSRVNDSQRTILRDYSAFISGKVSAFVPVPYQCYSKSEIEVVPPIGVENFHLLPNIMQKVGYSHLDPSSDVHPTFREAASNLLVALFSGDNIESIVVSDNVSNNRFTLLITYAFTAPISNATQTSYIGYDLRANPTNKVLLVLQVSRGIN